MIGSALKSAILETPVGKIAHQWRLRAKFPDSEKLLIYVHIGKCGGTSLWRALKNSPVINERFERFEKVHTSKPPILEKASYVVVVRNPIKRAVSAFNWRYKLVVDDGLQKERFRGEYEILTKYGTLNALAENLYVGDILNKNVAKEFRAIHHLKEDIAFYIQDLLKDIKPDQLFAVLAAETLDQDISDLLGIDKTTRAHENASQTHDEKKTFSKQGYENLRRFLVNDYAAIKALLALKNSTNANSEVLLA